MIFHVPHSSPYIPADLRSALNLEDQSLQAELLAMTDAYTDDLFGSHAEADDSTIVFPVSRLVVDPERFLDDSKETMARIGMGVIYERCSNGESLRSTPSQGEREALIQRFYEVHHRRLTRATEQELLKYGCAIILDCHSFPSKPLPYEFNQDSIRPDICIGTDKFHSPDWLFSACQMAASDEGLTTKANYPFAGSIVPAQYFNRERRVSSLMIEVNRSLYMDEATGERSMQYERLKASIGRIISRIRQAYHLETEGLPCLTRDIGRGLSPG